MKNSRRFECILWILTLAPLAAAALAYPFLPEEIPVGWEFSGAADAFGPKASIFLTAALPAAIQLMMAALPKIDPRGDNYARFARAYRALRVVLALFGLGLTAVQLASSLPGTRLNAAGLAAAGMGAMLAAVGNYLPKLRPNFLCGIRTPWTLASEGVWRKTHRLAGPCWVAGGAVMALGGLAPHGAALGWLTGAACALLAVPLGASYFYFRAERRTGK